jgi:hypothetical protein
MFAAGAVQELERQERKRKRKRDDAARDEEDAVIASIVATLHAVCSPSTKVLAPSTGYRGREKGSKTIPRVRKDLTAYFAELGPHNFRRHYRMHQDDFFRLHDLLQPKCWRIVVYIVKYSAV